MASGWHNKLARISRMDWAEVRTRAGQGLHRQSDLWRHRMGMRPATVQLREAGAEDGRFFFAQGEAPGRAELLRQHLPEQAAEIVREADEICLHRFRLLGYEGLDYGGGNGEIDWHLDRVHGKRAPLEPWFKIDFLNFALVGDHKIIWELNRHQHLVTLAKAWLLTNDEKYIRELMAQWRSWVRANPYPLGINWGSTLEVAFRSLSWIWVEKLLSGDCARERQAASERVAGIAEFRAELLPALAFHGRYIERYLSTYFSPNTHLLGEVLAMFFLGTLYPQMPHAARWKAQGWAVLLREAERQVRSDGVYFEQSLYYHVYALDFFLHARLLAAQNGIGIPAAYDAVLLRMLSVVEASAQAGVAEGFGDDDGGRLFDPRRNRTEHMTDPLALGALTFPRQDRPMAQLTEESIWLFGDSAVSKLPKTAGHIASHSNAFSDGGLYVLASAEPYPQTMVIDAGPHGEGRCGHGHADALSLRLAMNGARWLVDSGSGVYVASDPVERNAFRGTAAHNTMLVDGVDQAVSDEPFSWAAIPVTWTENWTSGKTFTYFAGSHNGYERLPDPVTHRRCVLHVNDSADGGVWLVRDVATGKEAHNLELSWHFASGLVVTEGGASELVASRPRDHELILRLIWPEQSGWKVSITQGAISPAYGRYETAPVARIAAQIKLPTEIATALMARGRTALRDTEDALRMVSTHDSAVHVYELHDANSSRMFLFAGGKQAWNSGPWSSDAEVLYCRMEHNRLVHLIVVAGSSVAWEGRPIAHSPRPSQFFEWRKQDSIIHAAPERFVTTRLFDELTGSSYCSDHVSDPTSSYAEKH